MNPDVFILFNGIRKSLSSMPEAENMMLYPQIPVDIMPALQRNFRLSDDEVPLYVHDTSMSADLGEGVVITDEGIHWVPDGNNPLEMDFLSWSFIQGVVISKDNVTFLGNSPHAIPVSDLVSLELAEKLLEGHTLPIVINPPDVQKELDKQVQVIEHKKSKLLDDDLSGISKLIKIAYGAYAQYMSSDDRSKKDYTKMANDFWMKLTSKTKTKTYLSELPVVVKRAHKLKENDDFEELENLLWDFYHDFPHPNTCLWLAQEYVDRRKFREAIYAETEGEKLIDENENYEDLKIKFAEMKQLIIAEREAKI